MKKKIRNIAALAVMGVSGLTIAAAHPTAKELKIMEGFPPQAEKQVKRSQFYQYPAIRWSFQHARELGATVEVSRGPGNVSPLPSGKKALETLSINLDTLSEWDVAKPYQGEITLEQWVNDTYTDSMVILHKGELVYEKYFNDMSPRSQHQMNSVTKSFVGTLALVMAERGQIDLQAPVTDYLPELKGSGWEGSHVQQLLNMTTGIQFREDYTDPEAEFFDYAYAAGLGEFSSDYEGPRSIYQFLAQMKSTRSHGEGFKYISPNSDVLGWVLARVSGKRLSKLLEDELWTKLGVARDAYVLLDRAGTEIHSGGLNVTARDAARFGQMILQKGQYNGQQVIPKKTAERILKAGDPKPFTVFQQAPWYQSIGYAYHDQWWTINNEHKAVTAIGIHGQWIYIDPVAEVVIVRQSSDPEAEGEVNEVIGPQVYDAIARHLMKRSAGR